MHSPAFPESPAGLLNGRPSAAWRLFDSEYKTNKETSRRISSLRRYYETTSKPNIIPYLGQIDLEPKQCILYHKLTLDKPNLLIDLHCTNLCTWDQTGACWFPAVHAAPAASPAVFPAVPPAVSSSTGIQDATLPPLVQSPAEQQYPVIHCSSWAYQPGGAVCNQIESNIH